MPASIDAPALTADGKPEVLYVGAEYCPFCAAERWPVVVALSRFGTWSGLSATDVGREGCVPEHSDGVLPRREVHERLS